VTIVGADIRRRTETRATEGRGESGVVVEWVRLFKVCEQERGVDGAEKERRSVYAAFGAKRMRIHYQPMAQYWKEKPFRPSHWQISRGNHLHQLQLARVWPIKLDDPTQRQAATTGLPNHHANGEQISHHLHCDPGLQLLKLPSMVLYTALTTHPLASFRSPLIFIGSRNCRHFCNGSGLFPSSQQLDVLRLITA
jgi:hypothetical protein